MGYENTARVITIPATEQPEAIVLRVAAYCRVSSSSDEQLNSFVAQNRYYTELISSNENWKLVDIYADEGVATIHPRLTRCQKEETSACRNWRRAAS